jgi:tetratricopeptide (TPR) repeat protein
LKLALKSDLKTYGEDHPAVARDRNNLGGAWRALGEYDKAIKYLELALKSTLNTYGEDHLNVAICRNNLGMVWH